MNRSNAAPKILAGMLMVLSLAGGSNQQEFGYPTANASASWINSPSSIKHWITMDDGSAVRSLLLRRDFALFSATYTCYAFGFVADASSLAGAGAFHLGVFITGCNSSGGVRWSQAAPILVWSANRGRPFRENATLQFTSGDLTLHDADGTLVWSSGTAGKPVAGISIAATGNLVLFDDTNSSIWESFAHPTNTLVLNQTLQEGMRLTADVNFGNSTAGRLYFTVLHNGFFAFVDSNPPQAYFSLSSNSENGSVSMTFLNGSLMFSGIDVGQQEISLPSVPYIQYLRLDPDGHLRNYEYDLVKGNVVSDVLVEILNSCDYPTVCGDYGICTSMQCNCSSRYFSPAEQPKLGCDPNVPLSCKNKHQQQILALPGVDYFIPYDSANHSSDQERCKQACMDNCSCKAALFRYEDDVTSGHCYLLTEVFSLHTYLPKIGVSYNSTMHLKVQLNSDTPNASHANQTRDIIIGVASGVLGIAIIVTGLLYRRFLHQTRTGRVCIRLRRHNQRGDSGRQEA